MRYIVEIVHNLLYSFKRSSWELSEIDIFKFYEYEQNKTLSFMHCDMLYS